MESKRDIRLKEDYREMLKIQDRPYLSWIVTKGEAPYAEEYLLSVRLRYYSLRGESGAYTVGAVRGCTVRVTLWDSYPNTAPNIKMLSIPPVFSPCWYSKGTYCPPVPWTPDTSLKDYLKQMLGAVIFDPELINEEAPANYKALEWYKKHCEDSSLFPSDAAVLSENSAEKAAQLEQAAGEFEEIIDSWKNR